MTNWNLLAEILGFLSGCALLWPAVVQNASLRRAFVTRRRFRASRSKLARAMEQSESVKYAGQPTWSATDQWLLTVGALLLVASFGIKLFLVWPDP